jgi:hypothetical protein
MSPIKLSTTIGRLQNVITVAGIRHPKMFWQIVTNPIPKQTPINNAASDIATTANMRQFIRMYSPHEAREDTVLFPAFRGIVSAHEFGSLWRARCGRNAVRSFASAHGKRIEEGNCGKQVDQSDDDYNLRKTEHPALEDSNSGTHCYLRQETESQSYKQIGPNPVFSTR